MIGTFLIGLVAGLVIGTISLMVVLLMMARAQEMEDLEEN